jgi:glycosyltransferase involved in cell wall biosynthesis
MKVLALAADSGGCGFYRVRAPSEEIRKLGVDVTVETDIQVSAARHPDGMVEVHEVQTDADLLIIQRPLDNAMTSVIKQAKKQGIATIVELDDDMGNIHKDNAAYDKVYGYKWSGDQWIQAAVAEADLMTVSTPALERYATHGRSAVLRNCVPDSIFDVKVEPSAEWPRVGWSGSVQTHPTDLQETRGAIGEVLKSNELSFSVIGDGEKVARYLKLDGKVSKLWATGWVPIDMYYEAVNQFIDIGIVPLEISPFNQAKSALKGLEFAALGIPFIASPTREYERMEAYGIGKIAKTPGDWRRHLQRMIDRPEETKRIGLEYRDKIKAEHTYSVNAPKWLEAWERAINYRKTHNA